MNEIQPELVVLDVMLPKKMVLKYVKQYVLIKFSTYFNVNCKDDEFDRVLGLELGADDYMTKPFL